MWSSHSVRTGVFENVKKKNAGCRRLAYATALPPLCNRAASALPLRIHTIGTPAPLCRHRAATALPQRIHTIGAPAPLRCHASGSAHPDRRHTRATALSRLRFSASTPSARPRHNRGYFLAKSDITRDSKLEIRASSSLNLAHSLFKQFCLSLVSALSG